MTTDSHTLVGRTGELETLRHFTGSIKDGPAALVLTGDAGIGKSTLWREGLRMAHEWDFQVLRCHPVESEAQLAFTALSDLLTDVPALVAEAPADAELVIFHSAVLNYVTAEGRAVFAEVLRELSHRRPITWISNEGRSVVPEISALAPPSPPGGPREFLLGRTTFVDGTRRDEFLASAQPHGAELTWHRAD